MSLTRTLKVFEKEGVDLSKAYFQAYLKGKTLHYRNKLLPCYNLNVKDEAPKIQKVTFKDVVDNNYQFCGTCTPYFVGPSGWYRVELSIEEMESLRNAYKAAEVFLENIKTGKITPTQVKNFYDRVVTLRQGTYPKAAFKKWVKPRLKTVLEALSFKLPVELLENTFKLYNPWPQSDVVQYHYVSFKTNPYQLDMTDAWDKLSGVKTLYDLYTLMCGLDVTGYLHNYKLGNGDLLLRKIAVKQFSSAPALKDCFEMPPAAFRALPPGMQATVTFDKKPTAEVVEIAASLFDPKTSDVSLSEAFKLAQTLVK